ncbi:hypothetical protein D3C72_1653970 [compost metagenome]
MSGVIDEPRRSPLEHTAIRRRLVKQATRQRGRTRLPRPGGRAAARPDHAGRTGRHEPLSLSPRLQGGHGDYAQGLRQRAARRPGAPTTGKQRQRHRRHVRRRLQLQRTVLRSRPRHPGHDPHRLSKERRGHRHPFRRGAMFAGRAVGGGHGHGHLRHIAGRRPRTIGSQPARPLQGRPPDRRGR